MKLYKTTRQQFIDAITDDKADGFAKTFRSKADMGGDKFWNNCIGAWEDNGDNNPQLMGAIIVTISVRAPHVANLQLLHTFNAHRRKGVAKELCDFSLWQLWKDRSASYMRVSSEIPAIPFYEKIGWTMLGEQKSGCQLGMMKITGPQYKNCEYDINDPVIKKAVFKKGKGGCVKTFFEPNEDLTLF